MDGKTENEKEADQVDRNAGSGAEKGDPPEEDKNEESVRTKAQLMSNYENLLREIEAQNNVVSELKERICAKCRDEHSTEVDESELKKLRTYLEKENLKLRCLLRDAVLLQGEDPSHPWTEIPIATTLHEDNMPLGIRRSIMESVHKGAFSEDEADRGTSRDDELDTLCRLLEETKRNNKKCQGSKTQHLHQEDDQSSRIDSKFLKNLKRCMQNKSRSEEFGKCESAEEKLEKICKELNRSYNMQDRLVQDNVSLEGDRFKLQEELLDRDTMIENLQRKLQCMKCELQKLCREKRIILKDTMQSGNAVNLKTIQRLEKYKACITALKTNIDCMQTSIERLRVEMGALRKERNEWEHVVQNVNLCGGQRSQANEVLALQKNYTSLLADYCKKENELKELQIKMKDFVQGSDKEKGQVCESMDNMKWELLKKKLTDLHEEQEEFKCLIKEQSQHLDEYRDKYMTAQQTVEEQKCIIAKMEITNKGAENHINMEINRIRTKFQEKIDELSHLPKLLENEQIKLAAVCKEKVELEQKLRIVCREFKALKAQLGGTSNNGMDLANMAKKLKSCEHEFSALQKLYEALKIDKDLICERLCKTQEDLNTLRTESARIIALTKERSESQRETLQSRIDSLEKDLAQCRAAACLSISDREEVIKEMRGQLCTLSNSFDAAQTQIKTLRNHICYLSTDNSYPIKYNC